MKLNHTLKNRSNVICREKLIKPSTGKSTRSSKSMLETQGPQGAIYLSGKTRATQIKQLAKELNGERCCIVFRPKELKKTKDNMKCNHTALKKLSQRNDIQKVLNTVYSQQKGNKSTGFQGP